MLYECHMNTNSIGQHFWWNMSVEIFAQT